MARLQNKFIGGLSYTIDNIVIRCLAASYKKFDIYNTLSLKQFFEKYDENVTLRKPVQSCSHNQCSMFIFQFSSAESAAKVLQENNFLNGCITVEAVESLKQPDGQKFIEQLTAALQCNNINFNYNCYEDDKEASILSLNDDCVEHIFKYLDLSDQIYFAVSCRRMCDIFTRLFKTANETFSTDILQDLTSFKARILIQIIGPQVEKLFVDYQKPCVNEDLVEVLANFLTNVKYLEAFVMESFLVEILIKKMALLEDLAMVHCPFAGFVISDQNIFKNLKRVHIIYPQIQGDHQMVHISVALEHLAFFMIPSPIYPILRNQKNLKFLDTRYSVLHFEDYEYITNNLLQLETLIIDCRDGNFSLLPKLPKLRELEIKIYDTASMSITTEFFSNLEKYLANQLERLTINLPEANLEIVTFVSKLVNLKVLKWFNNGDEYAEYMELFANLSTLEEFYFRYERKNDIILKLLENCLKLKQLHISDIGNNLEDLIEKSVALLQQQKTLDLRDGWVEFVIYSYNPLNKNVLKEYSNVLKIKQQDGRLH